MSYTETAGDEAQWGTDISENAVTMVNTKLELEIQDSLFDELDLTLNVLRGTGELEFERLKQAGPNPDVSLLGIPHALDTSYSDVNLKHSDRY
jgi:hypothetical protein